jgi:hypothetical protein
VIGHDLAAVLPWLQAEAESRMRRDCLIRRPGELATDPETGAAVPTYTPVYAGKCRLQSRESAVAVESARGTVTTQGYEVHVPVDAGPFKVGDEVLTGSRSFRVDGLHEKDEQTAQRLPVTETT